MIHIAEIYRYPIIHACVREFIFDNMCTLQHHRYSTNKNFGFQIVKRMGDPTVKIRRQYDGFSYKITVPG